MSGCDRAESRSFIKNLFTFLRSSPRANITLSGKKKRKLLKQLQHMHQEKASMEGEEGLNTSPQTSNTQPFKSHSCHSSLFFSVEAAPSKKKTKPPSTQSKKKKKSASQQGDVEMIEAE